jgi:hypothetical protein
MRIELLGDPPRHERGLEARRALEVYIAGRFRGTVSEPATWSGLYARTIPKQWRATAERIIATLPPPSEKEMAEATALVKPMLEEMKQYGTQDPPLTSAFLVLIWLWVVALLSLACALLFRGGLATWVLGVAVVKRDGSRASRLRVFWRGLVAWSPTLALPLAIDLMMSLAMPTAQEPTGRLGFISLLAWALYVPLAIWSALLPERGIQDRMAGTWLVPR